jgi:Acetyltransferase (GNAT) domain
LPARASAIFFAPPGHREFFLDLAANPSSSYLVHISRVEIGATCAAANLGIVFGDRYYHVLASYVDGAVAHYGPGALHLRELLAYAIRQGLKAFDFTIGNEPYKLDWCDTVLRLYDYAAATRWRGVPARALLSMQRRGKRLIKQTPLLWRIASHARNAMGVLTGVLARAPRQRIDPAAAAGAAATPSAPACVMGDMDLLRPLALAAIPCAVVGRSGSPSLCSRYAASRLAWDDYQTTEPNVSSSFWWRSAPLRPNRRSCSIRRTARPC